MSLVYFPNMPLIIAFPIFLSSPAFDVGIPVCLANCCLAWVIPSALFQENDNPGIFMFSVNMIAHRDSPDALSGCQLLFLEQSVYLSYPKDKR